MTVRHKGIMSAVIALFIVGCVFAEENKTRLILPAAIYAVPGQEMNLYFDNVLLVPNVTNYRFDVECKIGRQDETRWRCTPESKDVGSYPFRLRVLNGENKVMAEGSSALYVTPADAGKGRDITILVVGDSLTDASVYPNELNRLLQGEGNPKVTFIGSHAGGGRKPDATRVAHEGRGGWTWEAYCTRWNKDKDDYRSRSPFLCIKENQPQLGFQKYCDQYNAGNAPDFITVLLGCNDTFWAQDHTIEKSIDTMFQYADILISEFQKVSKDTRIGLLLLVPPAATQDAFGANYQCGQTRWQYRRNQHRAVERMMEKFSGKESENIFLIPAYINLDCVNNYPKREERISSRNDNKVLRDSNSVHPATAGYEQIADSIYGWLKYRLNPQEQKTK